MTRKLYYEDSSLTEATAVVTGCEATGKGWLVTLDATVFYPEGGGQACDLGTLDGVAVLDVQERGEDVVHLCQGPLAVGTTVEGRIDWDRRFDLMQQHTGEHMVSGVICGRYGCHNVGFHVGSEVITIDFDGPVPPEDLPMIEAQVNAAIWQDLPVRRWVPEPSELPEVAYRSKRVLPWPVRIVQIPGVDSCACCGVHVGTTGQVGLVKLFSCVKFHQGVRIEMACGRRALMLLNEAYDQNRQVSQTFSAKIMETGAAARRMNERLAELEYRITGLERQIFDAVAERFAGKGDVLWFHEGLEPAALRELADRIADRCGGIAAVFCPKDEGHMVAMICREGDLRELGKAMNAALNGRGGGKPGFFQGSVKADRTQIEAFWERRDSN